MKRVFLKLSGEALAGEKKTGFDEPTVTEVARQVKQIVDGGCQVGIVIGGGNFWRGRSSETIDRTKADQIGMLATIMNCIYVSEIFRSVGMMTQILTPFECGSMTKLFSKDRANKYFEKGMVVFFAGGTGHPYFSTDTGIVLRAIEMDAEGIFLAKAIDSGYGAYHAYVLFLGMLTGVGGGMFRDVLAGIMPAVLRKHVYACASLVGAICYLGLLCVMPRGYAMFAGAVIVVVIRLLASHYKWNIPRVM